MPDKNPFEGLKTRHSNTRLESRCAKPSQGQAKAKRARVCCVGFASSFFSFLFLFLFSCCCCCCLVSNSRWRQGAVLPLLRGDGGGEQRFIERCSSSSSSSSSSQTNLYLLRCVSFTSNQTQKKTQHHFVLDHCLTTPFSLSLSSLSLFSLSLSLFSLTHSFLSLFSVLLVGLWHRLQATDHASSHQHPIQH